MAGYKLTVRHGPAVDRSEHPSAEAAIEALRSHLIRLQAAEDLPEVRMLRTFKPEDRVRARLEISSGGLFRRREAGVDVMGDGSVVGYAGGTFRRPLEGDPEPGPALYDALAEALRR